MDKIQIDYIPNNKNLLVAQHKDMYHFNTDSVLLGEFINISEGEEVLDVGTNNGILLVYIINKKGKATGIEINDKAIDVARYTLSLNNMDATLINGDFSEYIFNDKFDVIISNPPYFNNMEPKERNDNDNIAIARHESSLSLHILISKIKDNLKDKGRAYLVYRYDRYDDLLKEISDAKMYINKECIVSNNKKIITVLVEFSNNKTDIYKTTRKI